MTSIEKDFYMQILCSSLNLNNNEHLINDAVSLKCGHSMCRNCLENSNEVLLRCRHCNTEYKAKDLKKLPVSNVLKLVIKSSWKEMVLDLRLKLKRTIESLIGEKVVLFFLNLYNNDFLRKLILCLKSDDNINQEVEKKFVLVENEIDLRIESIIKDLHEYREEFRHHLDEIKKVIEICDFTK